MYELRYTINNKSPLNYEVLGTYPNYAIAYSKKKLKRGLYPGVFNWDKMNIVKV